MSTFSNNSTCPQNSPMANNPDYICNPQTGRWVRKDGPIGQYLTTHGRTPGAYNQQKGGQNQCPQNSPMATNPDYICNPQTGRWVRRDGPVGQHLTTYGRSPGAYNR